MLCGNLTDGCILSQYDPFDAGEGMRPPLSDGRSFANVARKGTRLLFHLVVTTLLEKLQLERLVLDWRKRQQTRAAVRQCIEIELDNLPPAYGPEVSQRKCDLTYQHVYDSYFGEGRSIYATAA